MLSNVKAFSQNDIKFPQSEFPKNIFGVIDSDGFFKSRVNTFPFAVNGLFQLIYFKGQIVNEIPTSIEVILSTNIILVILIYLGPLIAINILFGDNSLMGTGVSKSNGISSILMMEAFLFILIKVPSYFAIRKFEKQINELGFFKIVG